MRHLFTIFVSGFDRGGSEPEEWPTFAQLILAYMLDMGGGIFHQPLPLAQIRAQGGDLGIRSEAAA